MLILLNMSLPLSTPVNTSAADNAYCHVYFPSATPAQVIEHQMGILDENRQIRSDLPTYIDLARRLDLALVGIEEMRHRGFLLEALQKL
jgi:hypothetical protein